MLRRMDSLYWRGRGWLQGKMSEFLYQEDGDVNIVSIVVLIGIVIIVAVIFKDSISKLVTDLFAKITTNATNAIDK